MREVLREDIVQRSEPAERIRRRLARSESANILANLVESEIATLREISNHVTQDQIDEVAKTLIVANRIYIFAQGHATVLADLMDRRLRRSGHNTMLLKSQGRDLAEHLLTINQNDAVLSFAFHVPPPGLFLVLKQAETVSAKSILISDSLGLSLKAKPTMLLAAPRGEESEYQTLTVPMAICNSLVLTLARSDAGQSLQALDDLSKLMDYIECENNEFTQDDDQP
jgi:DNA-binding MurR/RpiR family transcriptional regulator